MNQLHDNIKKNLLKADFSDLPYHLESISNKGTYTGHTSYFTILFFHQACHFMIDGTLLKILPGNIILLRCMNSFQVDFTVYHNNNDKITSSPSYQLTLDQAMFHSNYISSLCDCPILYDLLSNDYSDNEYLFFDINEGNIIQYYADLLLYECSSCNVANEKCVSHSLLLFLTQLHKTHHQHLLITESTMMPDQLIGSFLKYMTEHSRDVTLTQMAKHFSFHPSYLSGLFKTLAGYTFSEKLLDIRLEQAKRLLVTSNLTIEQIVDMIGFKEKSYFYKCFKKQYNTTPSKFRKEHQTLPFTIIEK